MPDTVDTVIGAADDGWGYNPKHVKQFADINKLYIVASCWIIIDTHTNFLKHGRVIQHLHVRICLQEIAAFYIIHGLLRVRTPL